MKKINNKKAEMVSENTVQTIIAVAGVILIIFVAYNLLSTNYDVADEATKAFFETLDEQIRIADNGGLGEFLIWDYNLEDEIFYFLVYFGDSITYLDFKSTGNNVNHICVCSSTEGVKVCNSCMNLARNVEYLESVDGNFIIGSGEKIAIKRTGDSYEFILV